MSDNNSLLQRLVRNSNLIEGIVAFPGDSLYEGHYRAAQVATKGNFVHPNRLHQILCENVGSMENFAGKYRTHGIMMVGDTIMPKWELVPELMRQWYSLVQEFLSGTKDLETGTNFLHVWLLCIHPYEDGNGRTARLSLNNLRVCKGLPLEVVRAARRAEYYSSINSIESVFREYYSDSDLYPAV